jgi:hypothetical protein
VNNAHGQLLAESAIFPWEYPHFNDPLTIQWTDFIRVSNLGGYFSLLHWWKLTPSVQFRTTQYNATLHYSATLCGKVAFYGNLQ